MIGKVEKTVEDVKDANDRWAFHFADREGQTNMCKCLLEEIKLDVNVKDADGETPLVNAVRQGRTARALYLVDHGAYLNIASNFGATALHHAAGIGVNVDSESDVRTPLVWAASYVKEEAEESSLMHSSTSSLLN